MSNVHSKITSDFLEKLERIINDSTVETLEQLFGHRVHANGYRGDGSDIIVAYVSFLEGTEKIRFCFVFDRPFIGFLTSKIYSIADFSDEEVRVAYEDTASELSNIICNQIKYFMNSHGFHSVMELPVVETPANGMADIHNENIVHVNFTSSHMDMETNAITIGMVA